MKNKPWKRLLGFCLVAACLLTACSASASEEGSLIDRLLASLLPQTEYPKSETNVKVTTWPSGFNRAFASRECRFTTGTTDRVFAELTSYWLVVNMETRKIAIAQRELADFNLDEQNAEHIFDDVDKLNGTPDAPVMGEFQIYEHQIDVNCHLNNTEYASLVQDALGVGCYPTELQINYQKEIPPQSTVVIRGNRDNASFSMTGYVDGIESFNAVGKLQP